MQTRRTINRLTSTGLAVAAAAFTVALSGCGTMMQPANMVALSTQLRSANEVPPVVTSGGGSVDAAFNKNTMQLRWKVNYSGLTGNATAGHFHGPAAVGVNAGVALGWTNPITNGVMTNNVTP